MNPENQKKPTHSLRLEDRRTLFLDGISDVVSFDEKTVLLVSDLGLLSVEGEELHVVKMNVDTKEFEIVGKIAALAYLDKPASRKTLFRRA